MSDFSPLTTTQDSLRSQHTPSSSIPIYYPSGCAAQPSSANTFPATPDPVLFPISPATPVFHPFDAGTEILLPSPSSTVASTSPCFRATRTLAGLGLSTHHYLPQAPPPPQHFHSTKGTTLPPVPLFYDVAAPSLHREQEQPVVDHHQQQQQQQQQPLFSSAPSVNSTPNAAHTAQFVAPSQHYQAAPPQLLRQSSSSSSIFSYSGLPRLGSSHPTSVVDPTSPVYRPSSSGATSQASYGIPLTPSHPASPLSPSATLVERSLSTQSVSTSSGGFKLQRTHSGASALLAQLRHIELGQSQSGDFIHHHPLSSATVSFDSLHSSGIPEEEDDDVLVLDDDDDEEVLQYQDESLLFGTMSPTFDFNAFINSASPPSSPVPGGGGGGGGHSNGGHAPAPALAGTEETAGVASAFPVFDPGQPPGPDEHALPAWATATELGPSSTTTTNAAAAAAAFMNAGGAGHPFAGPLASGTGGAALTASQSHSSDGLMPFHAAAQFPNGAAAAAAQQQGNAAAGGGNAMGSSPVQNHRAHSMDAMLFSSAANAAAAGGGGSMSEMLAMGVSMAPNQSAPEAGAAAGNGAGGVPFFGMDMMGFGAAGGMNFGGGAGARAGGEEPLQQPVWAGMDQSVAAAAAAGGGGVCVPLATAPLPQLQHIHPQLPMHPMPQHFSQQQQAGSMPVPGQIPAFYSSRAVMTNQTMGEQPQQPQAQGGVEAVAQAERDYRARIAAHHSHYLQSSGVAASSDQAAGATTAAAATPQKQKQQAGTTAKKADGGTKGSAKSKGKTSSSKASTESKNELSSGDSVTARVMTWAAGTGGPEAGLGSTSDNSNPDSNGKPGSGGADGPARITASALKKGTRVHRLSLQERRRLSRLASEGSDSGGSGGSAGGGPNSRSQSQSEASGAGVMGTTALVPGGGASGPNVVGTSVPDPHARTVTERTKRSLAAGNAAANVAADQDSHSSNYNGSKSKSASSGDDEEIASKSVGSSARAVRESSGEGGSTDTDPVFHGPYHEIAVTANAKGGPKHMRNSYSSSGFDILGALTKVATRKNPRILLGPIDLSCAFTVSDALVPDHPLIYVSETFTRLTGYQPADVLGKNCRFLQAPDGNVAKGSERLNTDGRAVSHMRKHMDKMRECQASLINYKKNGKAFINLVTIVPIPWGDSHVIQYLVGFQVDLVEQPGAILEKDSNGQYVVNYTTAARRTVAPSAPPAHDPVKEAIEERNRQVNGAHKLAEIVSGGQVHVRPWARLLLDNAQDLIYVLSLKGVFLYVSPSVERILGYKADELIGRSISDFCHPSDVVPVFRELKDSTSNASIAAAARKSVKAAGGYKALTKGGAGQSGPQVNLLLRMRHRTLGHQWIESVGKLHLEQGKGRKVVISSGRPRSVFNLSWDQVRRTTDDREPAFWSRVSLDGLVLSSTSRTAAVLGCTPANLQGQHLIEMANGEAVPSILQALRSRSVSMVSHMLQDTVGHGEAVPVVTTFYPSVQQAIAMGTGAGAAAHKSGGASDELPTDRTMTDADGSGDAASASAGGNGSDQSIPRDITASIFVHIRRATSEMPLEANIAYMDDLQMLKMQAQLNPGTLQVLPSAGPALAKVGSTLKPITADMPGEAGAAAAAAADLAGAGSVFTELSTFRSSSWVFELHQLKIMNKKLKEEVKAAQRRGRLSTSAHLPATPGNTSTPAAGAPSSATQPSAMSTQQLLAHQQQMAAQSQAMMHHPSHANSIVGSLNGQHSFSSIAMGMEASTSSMGGGLGLGGPAPGGPTPQSPSASRVLPPQGLSMSGRANELAAAGLRRPGIVPMQHHQQGSAYDSSHMGSFNPHLSQQQQQHQLHHHQQQMHHAQLGMNLAHDGSMSQAPFGVMGGMTGVPMDSTPSHGPGSMSSGSIFDAYPNQHRHPQSHAHSHHLIIPDSGNDSSGNASGETSTTATSLENSSGGSGNPGNGGYSSRSGSGSADRNGSSSAEETMKEQKRRVDASAAILSKAASTAAQQQQQHPALAGRKRSAAGDILPHQG